MEQLRTFLAAVKKHHFWILCGLACIVGLAMYFVSSNSLGKIYESKKSSIKVVDDGIIRAANGPLANDDWVKFARDATDKYRNKIYAAWTKLYRQQKDNVYIWPKELGAGFVKAFSNDSPKNVIPKDDLDEYRQYYQNFIVKSALPGLASSVNAEWVAAHEEGDNKAPVRRDVRGPRVIGPGGNRFAQQPRPEQASLENHPVVWDAADQQRLVDNFTWDPDPPTEVEVRFAQEEMWVLKAIFDSIARANTGANVSTDAVVREIHEALVGIDANSTTPLGEGAMRIFHSRPPATLTPGGPSNGPLGAAPMEVSGPRFQGRQQGGGGRGGRGQGAPGPRGGRGGRVAGPGLAGPPGNGQPDGQPGASSDPTDALKNWRYVDSKGKPLAASELATSNTPEYLLMPFRLVLVCDEARFPVIVSELANSPLPLEVREVRVNAKEETAQQGPRGRDRSRPGMSGPHNQGEAGSMLHNATVEIWGIAYLISRPDPKKLGLTEAAPAAPDASAKPADGKAADATAPAATTGTAEPAKPAAAGAATDTTQPPPANGGAATATTEKPGAKEAAPPDSTTTPPVDKNAAPEKTSPPAAK